MKDKPVRKLYILPFVCLIICAVVFGVYAGNRFGEDSIEFFAMDTYCTAKTNGAKAEKVNNSIKELVKKLDADVLSRQNESSLVYSLNENRGGPITEIKDYLEVMNKVCRDSGGAFDYTLGKVSDLWDFGGNPQVPGDDALETVLSSCGADKVIISYGSVSFPEGLSLDFGACGKGIGLDEIRDNILDEGGIKSSVVSLGGSILLYGNRDFTVGIRNPESITGYVATLNLPACCVSTSGNYERYFEENGKRYHHILDPKTGYPVDNGLVSVTVVSDSGILSDILSTACFVLGLDKGMSLASKYGCTAVFIDDNKCITASKALEGKVKINADSYTLRFQ
ncbi:MAG: FAD:protein FMN transferase [Clostridia bacterium]|nr:FAD:protein FMN transferase [Clostridia bacterium]